MEIYLMQHGPALSKEQDPEEGLSPNGKERLRTNGKALNKLGVTFDIIISSPKKRSRQTAQIVAEETGFEAGNIIETEKVKALTPPGETIRLLSEFTHLKRVLIAGHLPSVSKTASYLLNKDSNVTIDFEMGACCRVDTDDLSPGSGHLKWYMISEQLRLIAC